MVPVLSLLSLAFGATLAVTAADAPSPAARETWGGMFLLAGLALLGAALPLVR